MTVTRQAKQCGDAVMRCRDAVPSLLGCPCAQSRFRMKKFHHVEFYCGDATTAASRFVHGLGMSLVAKSDQVLLMYACVAILLCN